MSGQTQYSPVKTSNLPMTGANLQDCISLHDKGIVKVLVTEETLNWATSERSETLKFGIKGVD